MLSRARYSAHGRLRGFTRLRARAGGHTTARMMRSTVLALSVAAAGCAHAPARPPARARRSIETPQLVVNPPPRTLYRFVGRVAGVARTGDLVEAARVANDDLRWKAHVLGADVVRIDYVAAPPEHGHDRRRVLLAGRAYKAISHQ
jgi:hypothetical protein